MKKLVFSCTLLLSSIVFVANASTGPYVELNMGYVSTGSSTINNVNDFVKESQDHFGYNLNAGISFLGLGAEVGYTRFADINYKDLNGTADATLYGVHLALKSEFGLGPIFVMGKLGLGRLFRGEFKVADVQQSDAEKTGLYFGFGAGIKFMPTLAAVLQHQQILGRGDMPNSGLTSVGLRWTI